MKAMPDTTCAHCGAPISDPSTAVESDGATYCCNNCARSADDSAYREGAEGTCAHCATTIVDASTLVEQDGMIFCCRNCAAAMAEGEQPTGPTY